MTTDSGRASARDGTVALAARLAEFAVGARARPLPADVAMAVRRQVLDSLGVAVAARATDVGSRIEQLLPRGEGPSTVLGSGGRAPEVAALLNGVLVHGLDFDDTYQPGIVHVGAVIVPAALAVAEAAGLDGAEVERSIAIGYELHTRIGEAASGRLHDRGFHATPVCGVLAAAVTAGCLKGLDARTLVHAMGIAGSLAGGLQQFLDDGADTKPIHAGWAAQAGLHAADFAAAGFAGPAGVLEGRYGLYATHAGPDSFEPEVLTRGLGESWNVASMSVKPYPCCHLMHAAVDAALALRAEGGFEPADVVSIRAHVARRALGILAEPFEEKRRPTTPYSAKFSLPYAVAVGLLDDHVDLRSFDRGRLGDPAIYELIDRTSCLPDPDSRYPTYFDGMLEIDLADGRTLRRREAVNRGSPERPLTDDELAAKFEANCDFAGITRERAQGVVERVLAGGLVPALIELDAALSGAVRAGTTV